MSESTTRISNPSAVPFFDRVEKKADQIAFSGDMNALPIKLHASGITNGYKLLQIVAKPSEAVKLKNVSGSCNDVIGSAAVIPIIDYAAESQVGILLGELVHLDGGDHYGLHQ